MPKERAAPLFLRTNDANRTPLGHLLILMRLHNATQALASLLSRVYRPWMWTQIRAHRSHKCVLMTREGKPWMSPST